MEAERSSDKRQRIIDAAVNLFSEKGYHGATTALISKEAGVSQGLLFHYFRGKEELFTSIAKDKYNMFTGELERRVGNSKNAVRKLEVAVSTFLRLVQREEKFAKIVIKEVRGGGENLQELTGLGLPKILSIFRKLIKEGIEQGVFREVDDEVAATCLFGMLIMNTRGFLEFGDTFSLDETAKGIVDILLKGIAKV